MTLSMSALPSKILSELTWRHEDTPELLRTNLAGLDDLIEGCPRGRITEVAGPISSGRTTLLHSILAEGTRLGEFCALIDTQNAFDPASASAAGVDLRRLVWIRCNGSLEHAIKTADLLIHSGGFGVIAFDLCEVPARMKRRLPLSWWYRFRRAIENTPSVFAIFENEPNAKACASLLIETNREEMCFRGAEPFQYLDHVRFQAVSRKPMRAGSGRFAAYALR